jgi:hypothetical protein
MCEWASGCLLDTVMLVHGYELGTRRDRQLRHVRMSVRSFFRMEHLAPSERIFMKFGIWGIFNKICL